MRPSTYYKLKIKIIYTFYKSVKPLSGYFRPSQRYASSASLHFFMHKCRDTQDAYPWEGLCFTRYPVLLVLPNNARKMPTTTDILSELLLKCCFKMLKLN